MSFPAAAAAAATNEQQQLWHKLKQQSVNNENVAHALAKKTKSEIRSEEKQMTAAKMAGGK